MKFHFSSELGNWNKINISIVKTYFFCLHTCRGWRGRRQCKRCPPPRRWPAAGTPPGSLAAAPAGRIFIVNYLYCELKFRYTKVIRNNLEFSANYALQIGNCWLESTKCVFFASAHAIIAIALCQIAIKIITHNDKMN